jgi:flagellar motor switch protein FliN/FliY
MSEGFLTQEEIDALLGKEEQTETRTGEETEKPSEEGDGEESTPNLELILDLPLKISVRLGEVKKPLQDIRRFTIGKVVELNSSIKDPVDILIGEKIIARGEVVIIDENFGVKITHIIDPLERIKKLQG